MHQKMLESLGKQLIASSDLALEVSSDAFACEILCDSHALNTDYVDGQPVDYDEFCAIVAHTIVHPSYRTRFLDVVDKENLRHMVTGGGDPKFDCEIRMNDSESKGERWCSMSILVSGRNGGDNILVMFSDITDRRSLEHKLDELRSQIDYDSLTGVYSRSGVESIISSYLTGPGKYGKNAMLFVDLDGFKNVNNNFGHSYGDVILSETAHKLQTVAMNYGGWIGRVGGDEFVVFLRDIQDSSAVVKCAEKLREVARQSFTAADSRFTVTASIGAAFYPDHGSGYRELFLHSDRAMYSVKNAEKDGLGIYDSSLDSMDMNLRVADSFNDQKNGGVRERMTDYIFSILYESTSPEDAIRLVLQLMGMHFDASRAFLAEIKDWKLHYVRDWHSDDVNDIGDIPDLPVQRKRMNSVASKPHQTIIINSESKDFSQLYGWLKDSGALNYRDFNDRWALLSLMLYRGLPYGYFGIIFRPERRWTENEFRLVSFVTRLISLFYYREKNNAKIEGYNKFFSTMLDFEHDLYYVVDADTRELLYANRAFRERHPDIPVGKICVPAPDKKHLCPVRLLDRFLESPDKSYSELCQSPDGDRWELCIISRFTWIDQRSACLFTVRDVTECKREIDGLKKEIERLEKKLGELDQGTGNGYW